MSTDAAVGKLSNGDIKEMTIKRIVFMMFYNNNNPFKSNNKTFYSLNAGLFRYFLRE